MCVDASLVALGPHPFLRCVVVDTQANHMAGSDKEVMRKAETIMTQADKDGDGVISFDEFVIVSKKFPNILFPAYSLGQKVTKRMGI